MPHMKSFRHIWPLLLGFGLGTLLIWSFLIDAWCNCY